MTTLTATEYLYLSTRMACEIVDCVGVEEAKAIGTSLVTREFFNYLDPKLVANQPTAYKRTDILNPPKNDENQRKFFTCLKLIIGISHLLKEACEKEKETIEIKNLTFSVTLFLPDEFGNCQLMSGRTIYQLNLESLQVWAKEPLQKSHPLIHARLHEAITHNPLIFV